MEIKKQLAIRSTVLKGHVNKYALLGLSIALVSIFLATCLVSYQLTGTVSIEGMIAAQMSNPALWALDLTPLLFAYWGQSFCYELANKAETIIEDKTRELVGKRADLESKLHYESHHDNLTNLPNDKLLLQRIAQAIEQHKKGEQAALVLLTIKQFGDINYSIGNFSANRLMVQFAEKLKSILLDPSLLQAYMGMNMVARVQGAVFAIFIPRLKEEHNLDEILSRILEETTANFMVDGKKVEVNTLMGVAFFPEHAEDENELVEHATSALLDAGKRNLQRVIFREGMHHEAKSSRVVVNELKEAVKKQAFEIFYQPIVSLEKGNVVGEQSMIHFTDEKYKSLINGELKSLIEGSSLVQGLTFHMLNKVIDKLEDRVKSGDKKYIKVYLYGPLDKWSCPYKTGPLSSPQLSS